MQQILSSIPGNRIVDPRRQSSAVLLPIYERDGQYHILFIKRSDKVKEHRGEISFPGGRKDRKDRNLLDTALRECQEEIGLNPEDAEVLGQLGDEITTTSKYIVTPFVAVIPWPYTFTMYANEVAEILEAPVLDLVNESLQTHDLETVEGKTLDAYTYHYQGRVIWGATARILNTFLGIFQSAMAMSSEAR